MFDVTAQMSRGAYRATSSVGGETQTTTKPVALRVSADERRRLTKSKPLPDLRYHYRIGAGALALEAAQLLPNDSEELADIINRAGFWVKENDEKLGNRYYQILERRVPQTAIGRAAIARHRFVDQAGPWSDEAGKAEAAMRQELHVPAAY